MNARRIQIVAAATTSLVVAIGACSFASDRGKLNPDLIIGLDCPERPGPAAEIAIEKDLYAADFNVLNRARLARELRFKFEPPVAIVATSANNRIVVVRGLSAGPSAGPEGKQPFKLNISLYVRPSTGRDEKMETELKRIADKIPTCLVQRIEKQTNLSSVEQHYDNLAKKSHTWFVEAQREAPRSDAYRVH